MASYFRERLNFGRGLILRGYGKRTVSIKRTVWNIFKITLLNVLYDPKFEGLNTLTYSTYNRDLRVLVILIESNIFSKRYFHPSVRKTSTCFNCMNLPSLVF